MAAVGVEEEEEYGLLEAIFGVKSTVEYEEFIEKMTGPAKWGFDPGMIRRVVFE